MAANEQAFRFIDLFAGLGGFHVALQRLGGTAVFAAEWDDSLNSLYRHNFKLDKVWGDINELSSPSIIAQEVPDHDVLTAGFPCQPFSKAGEQLGFADTLQGQLFFKVFEILKQKRPRHFILENVPNILRHRGGETKETIERMLEEIGYKVAVHRFSPHQFGIPQIRERAYFVGSQVGLEDFEWPRPRSQATDISSVVRSEPDAVRPIPRQTLRAIEMWDDFLRRSPLGVKLPSFPIWSMEFRATYPYVETTPAAVWAESGARGLEKYLGCFGQELSGLSATEQFELLPSHSRRENDLSFPAWKQNFIRQNRDFFAANRDWIDPWLAEWRPWELPSSLQKFEWNAQGGNRQVDDYVLQVRASGIRAKRPHTAPSLIAMTHTQVPILGANIAGTRRYMTPSECAELQSLEGIQLPENDLHAYRALGNAVNARVVEAIARPLIIGRASATRSGPRGEEAA